MRRDFRYRYVVVPAGILLWLKVFIMQPFLVQGLSMLPALKNNDIILVSKIGFAMPVPFSSKNIAFLSLPLSRQDIVVFRTLENDKAVKRVIAVEGDFYQLGNREILLNGKALREDYAINQTNYPEDLTHYATGDFLALQQQGRIPPGYVLLLGDNRKNSSDSRFFGLVPVKYLRGRVIGKF